MLIDAKSKEIIKYANIELNRKMANSTMLPPSKGVSKPNSRITIQAVPFLPIMDYFETEIIVKAEAVTGEDSLPKFTLILRDVVTKFNFGSVLHVRSGIWNEPDTVPHALVVFIGFIDDFDTLYNLESSDLLHILFDKKEIDQEIKAVTQRIKRVKNGYTLNSENN